ncbi:hypothetical protein LLE49_24525 [Alicyclobacillus tolerans]|uniref:hypothetical protein n=1 Tax=Alicyclobacillus tolerans TaxID=90970 RepID=UPI001F41B198|nr:hypothetical protein [Alicyclobacillus tolerans]MCF8567892.1 hypothetical protein [Alicyclobacillus tolerans]
MEFEVTDFSLEKFIAEQGFNQETVSRVQTADLIFLPSFRPFEGAPRAFQPDTLNFYKFLRRTNLDLNVELLENEGEEKTVSLHSYDIWLPVIWVAQEFLLPTIPSLIASYVYDRLRGTFTGETVDIHLNLYIRNEEKGITKHLDFSGPKEIFEKKFGTIDLNKMWEDD